MRDESLLKLATYASVGVAVILIAAKTVAWLLGDSVALLSSLVDSGLDAIASLLNLLAVRHALTPADAEHRFGHGKAEALAGMGQGAFIAGSALFLFVEAGQRFAEPVQPEHSTLGIAVMVLSIGLTGGLVIFQRYVMQRTRSLAIGADRLHYLGDLLTNALVIVSLLAAGLPGMQWADPLGAIVIAGIILKSAVEIMRQSYDHLMDREMSDDERERIAGIVREHPEAHSLHDLRTRMAGNQAFIQFHLELDPEITLREAHRISDEIEAKLLSVFPGAQIIIHQDPLGVDEPRAEFG